MWSGTIVPPGWCLCDGSLTPNGYNTPDLRGRFIVGYDPDSSDYDEPGNLSEAIGNDTPAFCVRGDRDFMSNDPLWGIDYLKWSVKESDNIEPILSQLEKGREFWPEVSQPFNINDYFYPVTEERLEKLILRD